MLNLDDKYQISECGIDQLKAIVQTNLQIFKGMYEQDPYPLEHYQETLASKKTKIYVVKISGQIIGDSVSFERDESLYIWILGVLKEHRGNGIATKLLERNEQFARDNNYKSLTAKVSNVSPGMLNLLIRRGYHITGIELSTTDTKYNVMHLELKI
jgi:ribosomal protein S18 acetylase RimI-like enzyme